MNVLMISSDRKVFKSGSAVRLRVIEYGSCIDELHVVVFAKKSLGFNEQKISDNVWLYSTNSSARFRYSTDAIKIGNKINDIDLITTQDPFETGWAGLRIARKKEAKLQMQIHTDFLNSYFYKESLLNFIRVQLAKYLLPQADCVRVVSRRIADSLKSSKISLKSEPEILPIFVDVKGIKEYVSRVDLHQKYPQFEKIILMASRLSKEKNISLAINVMKEVLLKYPKTGLVIIGEGPESAMLKLRVKKELLSNNIIFEPWSDDLISYYKSAEVFLVTSNYEGYGMTLIEAAASGCPIVTTDVGVVDEFFGGSNGALICGVGDKDCIEEGLIKMMEDELFIDRIKIRAYKSLELFDIFDKSHYLKKYAESWNKCF